jgi:hypothetical protein
MNDQLKDELKLVGKAVLCIVVGILWIFWSIHLASIAYDYIPKYGREEYLASCQKTQPYHECYEKWKKLRRD